MDGLALLLSAIATALFDGQIAFLVPIVYGEIDEMGTVKALILFEEGSLLLVHGLLCLVTLTLLTQIELLYLLGSLLQSVGD